MEQTPDRVQKERVQKERAQKERAQKERAQRRIDEIFGDVLPSTTSDERDEGAGRAGPTGDDELLANRPPHHDRD